MTWKPDTKDTTKIIFIAWTPSSRRMELLAERLDASLHFVHWGTTSELWRAPIKYFIQSVRTWQLLSKEKPDIVIVQNPPIFCVLVSFFYAKRYKANYIIDSHTAAFISWKWRWSVSWHRMLSQHALTTLVHNRSQQNIVKGWGCPYMLLAYTPGDYSEYEDYPLDGLFNVAVVSSFMADERPDAVFRAATRLPDVTFHVTGDANRLARNVLAQKPDNCHLTGYLPYKRYVGLLQEADAIMVLTTRDDTLLMGSFEAVSIGKPLITSNFSVLKDYFPLGTIHIPYTEEGIYTGVLEARSKKDELQREMLRLREKLEEDWENKIGILKSLCNGVQ